MSEQLQAIVKGLNEAKEQRGRLAMIAADSKVSPRTIYSVMHGKPASATTIDKLSAALKKVDRKIRKEKAE